MSDIELVRKGKESEQLLNNPAFIRAMEAVEGKLIKDLKNSNWTQRRLREKIYDRLKIASWLTQNLAYEVDSYKLAQKRLEATPKWNQTTQKQRI